MPCIGGVDGAVAMRIGGRVFENEGECRSVSVEVEDRCELTGAPPDGPGRERIGGRIVPIACKGIEWNGLCVTEVDGSESECSMVTDGGSGWGNGPDTDRFRFSAG